jgi:hypothetical protein
LFFDVLIITAQCAVREHTDQRSNGRHASDIIGSRKIIFEDDFMSVPTSIRGRCKLSDVQRVYTWLLDDYLQKAAQCTRYGLLVYVCIACIQCLSCVNLISSRIVQQAINIALS